MTADMTMVAWEKYRGRDDEERIRYLDAASNPPAGVPIHYWLQTAHDDTEHPATLTITDADGRIVKTFSSVPPEPVEGARREPPLVVTAGAHRVLWDGRYPEALAMPKAVYRGGGIRGPVAPPGTYTVEMQAGEARATGTIQIRRDPRMEASDADLQAQFDLLLAIRDEITRVHETVFRIRRTESAVRFYQGLAGDAGRESLQDSARTVLERLHGLEGELHQLEARSAKDLLNVPGKLAQRLASLSGAVAMGQAAPTAQMHAVHQDLTARMDGLLTEVESAFTGEVAAFERALSAVNLPLLSSRSAP
jgi:hypothetical protein